VVDLQLKDMKRTMLDRKKRAKHAKQPFRCAKRTNQV